MNERAANAIESGVEDLKSIYIYIMWWCLFLPPEYLVLIPKKSVHFIYFERALKRSDVVVVVVALERAL